MITEKIAEELYNLACDRAGHERGRWSQARPSTRRDYMEMAHLAVSMANPDDFWVRRMERALHLAAGTFERYAEIHRQKGPEGKEKAESNSNLAATMMQALPRGKSDAE